jgi:transposase
MGKIRTLNENDREMVRLYEEGMTLRAIANQFGVVRETVRQRINLVKRLKQKGWQTEEE